MGNWLLNLFTGGLVGEVKDGLLRAQQQYLTAEGDKNKLAAEQNVKYWQGRVDVAIAAAQHDKWWSPRVLMAYAVTAYIIKIVFWDSVLQWGVTPYPGDQVTFIVMTVVGFYFVSQAAESIASKIAGAFKR